LLCYEFPVRKSIRPFDTPMCILCCQV
jgi:hypothetical protein